MTKLRALLVAVGVVAFGGVSYVLLQPKPSTSLADLLDAGFTEAFEPAILECQVRMAQQCRQLPDGGLRRRYLTVRTKAWVAARDGGEPLLMFRWPKVAGQECFEPAGPSETSCEVVEMGTCSVPALCDDDGSGTQPVAGAQDRCACRNPAAGLCRYPNPDGGATSVPVPLGVTWRAPFAGAGCVRKPCEELAGDQGQSWPDECPGG